MLQLYETMIAAVDGRIQREQQAASLWSGIEKGRFLTRLTIQWAVPQSGLEFDARPHIGSDRTFRISLFALRTWNRIPNEASEAFASENHEIARLDMRVRSFELGQEPVEDRHGNPAMGSMRAVCVFECEQPR